MKVLFIRHAPAEDAEKFAKSGGEDVSRPLTAEGQKKMRKAAKGIKLLVPEIDLLAASPLIRSRETMEIIAACYGAVDIWEIRELAPSAAKEDLLCWLQARPMSATVALVGHEPDLSQLISWLLTGSEQTPFLSLKKGSACFLEFENRPEAGAAQMLWLLRPGQLRNLGIVATDTSS